MCVDRRTVNLFLIVVFAFTGPLSSRPEPRRPSSHPRGATPSTTHHRTLRFRTRHKVPPCDVGSVKFESLRVECLRVECLLPQHLPPPSPPPLPPPPTQPLLLQASLTLLALLLSSSTAPAARLREEGGGRGEGLALVPPSKQQGPSGGTRR